MKKFFIVLGVSAIAIACGNNQTTEKKAEEPAATTEQAAPAEDDKGVELIAASDCLTCHSVNDKINGPAYKDVAAKYANAGDTIVSHLAKKIIDGGAGVWGEVPMTPHPQISQADAEQMVKYVLLLKK